MTKDSPPPPPPASNAVYGDVDQSVTYTDGDCWYPPDTLCLRVEALRRLALVTTSETKLDKKTLDLVHRGMGAIVYTLEQVFPDKAKEHRDAHDLHSDATRH